MWRWTRLSHAHRSIIRNVPNGLEYLMIGPKNDVVPRFFEEMDSRTANPSVRLANQLASSPFNRMRLAQRSAYLGSPALQVLASDDATTLRASLKQLTSSSSGKTDVPVWLILYLLRCGIGNAYDARLVGKLVQTHLPSVEINLRPFLVAISVYWHLKYENWILTEKCLKLFMSLPSDTPDFLFDFLLQSTTKLPVTELTRKVALDLLAELHKRKPSLVISKQTLDSLFANRFVTTRIAIAAQQRMLANGLPVLRYHYDSFVRCIIQEDRSDKLATTELPSDRFWEYLVKFAQNPIFQLLDDVGRQSNMEQRAAVLEDILDYDWRWLPPALAPNIYIARDRLLQVNQHAASPVDDLPRSRSPSEVPTWLLLHVLRHKMTTTSPVDFVHELVMEHLPSASPSLQPWLLIMDTRALASSRAITPLRRVLKTFLELPVAPFEVHFNALLFALSHAPGHPETTLLAVTIMRLMAEKGFVVHSDIINELLRGQFATIRLAVAVSEELKRQDRSPTEEHLQNLVRLMGTHRRRRNVAQSLQTLQEFLGRYTNESVPFGPIPSVTASPRFRFTRWDRIYLGSFRRFIPALRFLRRAVQVQGSSPRRRLRAPQDRTSGRETQSLTGDAAQIAFNGTSQLSSDGVTSSSGEVSVSALDSDEEDITDWKTMDMIEPVGADDPLSIETWTAALRVAARDKKVTGDHLLRLFREGQSLLRLEPTLITYCVVIYGLLRKWEHHAAVGLWDELCELKLPLDIGAVILGVEVLTMNGRAHDAFALLETVHTRRSGAVPDKSYRSVEIKPDACVTVGAIHRFMVSLQRTGRPDVVFALWDHMEKLYSVKRDAYTLNILLKTARWSRKFNDSIRGVLAQFGIVKQDNTETLEANIDGMHRDHSAKLIADAVDPFRRPPLLLGFWKGKPASEVALQIARDILLCNWPELANVSSPVQALRASSASPVQSPLSDMIRSIRGTAIHDSASLYSGTAPARGKKEESLHYAWIFPTDLTFRAIIDTLDAESHNAEIPLVLAWMQHLSIVPSKLTIATALIHWSEVGMDAPLIEAIKGGPDNSPYHKFVRWITEWVGKDGMPTGKEYEATLARIRYYRESDYVGVVRRRTMRPDL
ncbi:hypothetical protein K474DRAFT_242956 [Panus rudis PR-1116 ss-1]|nr:hypothetical protein K474DRAFT_242956 [Panus rudis PR-1116 ss-1]